MLLYLAYSCPKALLISALTFLKVFYNYEITFKLILAGWVLVFWPLSLFGQHAILTFKAGSKDKQCWSFSDDLHQLRTFLFISFLPQNNYTTTYQLFRNRHLRYVSMYQVYLLIIVVFLLAICTPLIWWHVISFHWKSNLTSLFSIRMSFKSHSEFSFKAILKKSILW